MKKEFKASMTVEATFVICFCMIITAIAIITAYEIYEESMAVVEQEVEELDSVHMFLKKEMVMKLIE